MPDAPRILIAGVATSPHFRRWCDQLRGSGFDVHILHTGSATVNPEWYTDFTFHRAKTLTDPDVLDPQPGRFRRLLLKCGFPWVPPSPARIRLDSFIRILKTVRPDVLHSHGLNVNWENQLLNIYNARRLSFIARRGTWLYTTWGTDLDFFPKVYPEEDADIRRILSGVDMLATECDRDHRLAVEYGFRGKYLGKLPMFGGVDERLTRMEKEPPAKRRLLLIKGRDDEGGADPKQAVCDPVGRARYILDALEDCRNDLQGWEIVVLQATPGIRKRVEALAGSGMNIAAPAHFDSYEDVLSLFARARAFIAMTVNDGLPSALCEAMAAGAAPVHSDLEPVREWIRNGENGLLTPPDDVGAIAAAIRRIVYDDAFVELAAISNYASVEKRLLPQLVRERVIAMYTHIAQQAM